MVGGRFLFFFKFMHIKKWYKILKFLKISEGIMEGFYSFFKLKMSSTRQFTILLMHGVNVGFSEKEFSFC